MESLVFKPIDLDQHSELCIQFRKDSFFCSFGIDDQFFDPKDYLKWLQSKDPQRFGAFHVWENESIIGQLELGQRSSEEAFGYVNLYYLVPGKRGTGLSKFLDDFSMQFLKTLGYEKARLSVSPTNHRAMGYYKKNGWIDIGPRTDPRRTEKSLSEYPVHYMEKSF